MTIFVAMDDTYPYQFMDRRKNSGYDHTSGGFQVKKPGVEFLILVVALMCAGCPKPPDDEPLDYSSANIGVLKYISSGTFHYGGVGDTSTVSAFRISRHEITRLQFFAVIGDDPSNATYSNGTGDPVQMVNWYHAITFCNKLSIAEGLTPVYSVSGVDFSSLAFADIPTVSDADWNAAASDWGADGYRLPTEMEWLWAAMGGEDEITKVFAGSTGSNTIDDYAWHSGNSASKTHPVGDKLANEFGLFDMSGNVWEWCWDYSGSLPTGEVTDYRGPGSGTQRVYRGSSWNRDADICALDICRLNGSYNQTNELGFRVVRQ